MTPFIGHLVKCVKCGELTLRSVHLTIRPFDVVPFVSLLPSFYCDFRNHKKSAHRTIFFYIFKPVSGLTFFERFLTNTPFFPPWLVDSVLSELRGQSKGAPKIRRCQRPIGGPTAEVIFTCLTCDTAAKLVNLITLELKGQWWRTMNRPMTSQAFSWPERTRHGTAVLFRLSEADQSGRRGVALGAIHWSLFFVPPQSSGSAQLVIAAKAGGASSDYRWIGRHRHPRWTTTTPLNNDFPRLIRIALEFRVFFLFFLSIPLPITYLSSWQPSVKLFATVYLLAAPEQAPLSLKQLVWIVLKIDISKQDFVAPSETIYLLFLLNYFGEFWSDGEFCSVNYDQRRHTAVLMGPRST